MTLRQKINHVSHVGLNHDIICGGRYMDLDNWLDKEFKSGIKLFCNWKYAITAHLKNGKCTNKQKRRNNS